MKFETKDYRGSLNVYVLLVEEYGTVDKYSRLDVRWDDSVTTVVEPSRDITRCSPTI